MVTKFSCNCSNPPIGGLILADLIKSTNPVSVEWGKETSLSFNNNTLTCVTNNDVLRALIRDAPKYQMYGKSPIERTTIDHWLTLSLSCKVDAEATLKYLNRCLGPRTYLVSNKMTIADLAIFNEVYINFKNLENIGIPNHVSRWFELIRCNPSVQSVLKSLPEQALNFNKEKSVERTVERKQEGVFEDLPGAEMGKVIVRFPPEASGYLHIGHAKAALLNQYYQQAFNGKLIMRFDDTNPAKENVHFEQVILEDLEMLQVKPDLFTHTSQYFDIMLEYCERLMKEGKAYADNTPPEQMKNEREQKLESSNRSNTVEKNFEMWKEMLAGSEVGQKCCIRAKIDMNSLNGCMRDPTIYRCKNEPHPRTGTKYKVYPTYDFACPIVDAIENVTHTLRTTEYHDRDDQFYWFIDALKLRKPYIWEYSRLNMTNTVLSKRKLTWFVEQGLVNGWDDPRFPTVRGILRRGMTVEALKQFIIAQGSSKSVVFMEWDKIWALNKKVIDPIAPRYTALEHDNRIVVNVAGAKLEAVSVAVHPKNTDIGQKIVWVGPEVLIDYADAETLKENENVTFINWGNIMINKINKENDKIKSIDASLNLENKDFKKTLKLTWLCKQDSSCYPPTFCCYIEHLINKAVLAKDEDFKQFIGHNTWTTVEMLGDPALKDVKKGDIIQLQRRGFFKVEKAYSPPDQNSGVESSIILYHIPDGHPKALPTSGQPKKEKVSVAPVKAEKEVVITPSKTANSLNDEIIKQGDLVRNLKTQKAAKTEVDSAVKVLLGLKIEYKTISGSEWKPGTPIAASASTPTTTSTAAINDKINAQGEKVRQLKGQKADKTQIDKEVKILLELKAEYKTISGSDWKPGSPVTASAPTATTNSTTAIDDKINAQGEKVRQLKVQKADKAQIDKEVKTLLELKAEYKTISGQDWKPTTSKPAALAPAKTTAPVLVKPAAATGDNSAADINQKIIEQGDIVRNIKSAKAGKIEIDEQVKKLLALKGEYKTVTGQDWKPGVVSPIAKAQTDADEVSKEIIEQGDKIRVLKTNKADKSAIETEVKKLLTLKGNYKTITGQDWKPPVGTASAVNSSPVTNNKVENNMEDTIKNTLVEKINNQGNEVRNLKSSNGSKSDIDAAVKLLLDLKVEYKNLTGTDFPVAGRTPAKPKSAADNNKKKENKVAPKDDKKSKVAVVKDGGTASAVKKQTRLGLEATKEDNLPEWYSQVITKGEMIEYYDVSGCYILRHWSFAIWKAIRNWFDDEITKMGIKECYFPIFVSRAALEKEKDHIADFAPEVAWVTKSGDSELAEPIAVRPTSETVMYPAYAKWIQSYRDLPIRLNQWNNVVRWEFKHPQPFLRTREFLWQEGHTAFATQKEATDEVYQILDLYAKVYTDLLAIPVVKGRKTEKEKFAGGDFTTTVEAFVSASGRGIQGATSHHLGQNFSKMFDIVFEDPETQQKQFVYQNSWGITTRTIGVMIMIHADNQGLVLPPNVACIQVVIVPCGLTANTTDAERNDLLMKCEALEKTLKSKNLRVEGDYRDNYSPGWKYNHWELKGVPIRIELGPKDVTANQFVAVRRDTGEKIIVKNDKAEERICQLLKDIHESMLKKATYDLESHTKLTTSWDEFCKYLDAKNIILSPFCGESHCEEQIKADSARDEANAEPGAPAMGAKTLCIPFDQPKEIQSSDKCIRTVCTNKPKFYTLFGRSY